MSLRKNTHVTGLILNSNGMEIITYPFREADKDIIREILEADGIMVYPTETYYAIGCLATSAVAVAKIYQLKQRRQDAPLLVLINSWSMLDRYTVDMDRIIRKILKYYWPGGLTAILRHNGKLAAELNLREKTVGFRMTPSHIATELIGMVDLPLVGTSANISTGDSISEFEQTRRVFGKNIDLYIDGGETKGGLPSTVVEMTDSRRFQVIRQGCLDFDPECV